MKKQELQEKYKNLANEMTTHQVQLKWIQMEMTKIEVELNKMMRGEENEI